MKFTNNIKELINKALIYYDNQQENYDIYINHSIFNFGEKGKNEIVIIPENNIKPDLESHYEILGLYDHQTNIWIWSWLVPYFSNETVKLSKELLNYGLKLEPSSNVDLHFYLKVQFLNSRILIENDIELDMHLALISYLIKDKHLFIFPVVQYSDDNKTKYQTIYYIIK